MDLFLDSNPVMTKTAGSEVTLPEDPSTWQMEILQEIYKQAPYVADFDPQVVMDRVNPERMYGFGHIEVGNKTELQNPSPQQEAAIGVRKVRIPIIIKEGKLQPLDILVTADSQMLPLTEKRIRQALFRPQMFDVASRTPGDQSLISQLYPPYRQNYGFGGGGVSMSPGMGKEGAITKTAGWFGKSEKDRVKEYNHYADHMNAAIKASPNKSLSEADHDNVTREYNKKYGKNVPMLSEYFAQQKTSSMGKEGSTYKLGPLQIHTGKEGKKESEKIKLQLAHGLLPKGYSIQKTSSVLEAILPTINESDFQNFADAMAKEAVSGAVKMNKVGMAAPLSILAGYEPGSFEKREAKIASAMNPSVVQFCRHEGTYAVKTASHLAWAPTLQRVDRGQLVKAAGADVALLLDKTGSATMTTEEEPVGGAEESLVDEPQTIKDFGVYKVQDEKGRHLVGFVFPNLMDLDGHILPLALFTNGSQSALQGEVVGVAAGEGVGLPQGRPKGHGAFYKVMSDGKAIAMTPMDLAMSFTSPEAGGAALMGTTMEGAQIQVHIQPGVNSPTLADGCNLIVPDDWKWLPLDRTESVVLTSDPASFSKSAEARQWVGEVTLRASGDTFALSGWPIDKVASEERDFIDIDDALFYLAGMGVDSKYAMKKIGEALSQHKPVSIKVAHPITPMADARAEAVKLASASLAKMPDLRRFLVKEATHIPDPSAVDTLLSLGFINPENLMTFVTYLPAIDATQSHLCELLIASRLGMSEVPAYALERSIRAQEEVIEGLQVLAFEQN